MKKIFNISALILMLSLAACAPSEVDDIFDENPAERLDNAVENYKQAFKANGGRWLMQYFCNSDEEGYNFIMEFNNDGTVDISTQNSYVNDGSFYTDKSLWDVVADYGPVLTFNTYNRAFHEFSSPQSDGTGHGGDYEFRIISVEDAALGFALSVLHADEYNGQEIGSLQVLNGLAPKGDDDAAALRVDAETLGRVVRTFGEQYKGWKERNVFERQWVLRDFRKCVGRPADEVQARMQELVQSGGLLTADDRGLLEALVRYWRHQDQLLQSFEKDPQKRQEYSRTIHGWISDLQSLLG